VYESGSQLSKCHVTKYVDKRNNFLLKFRRLYTSAINEHQGYIDVCRMTNEWTLKCVY
jgi:hypothetical protein